MKLLPILAMMPLPILIISIYISKHGWEEALVSIIAILVLVIPTILFIWGLFQLVG